MKRWLSVVCAVTGIGVLVPTQASAVVSTTNFRFVTPTVLWDTNRPGQQLFVGQRRTLDVEAGVRTIAQFTLFDAEQRSWLYVHDCAVSADTREPAAVFTEPGVTEVNVAPIDSPTPGSTCITLIGDASVLIERIAVQDASPGWNYVAQPQPTVLTPSVATGRVTVNVRDAQVPAGAEAVALFVGALAPEGQVVSMHLDSCTGGAATPVQRFVTPAGGFGDNMFIAPVDASGQVCFRIVGGQPDEVVVTRWGHLAPGVVPTAEGLPYSGWTIREMPGFTPVAPRRLFDTRDRGAPMADRETYRYRFTGLPATATAVALNITVTGTTGPGFVSAFPCGGDVPEVSNVNFTGAGETVPNFALVALGRDDDICFFAGTSTHLLVDYSGYFAFDSGDGFTGGNPLRVWDSRPGQGFDSAGPLTGGGVHRVGNSGSVATAAVYNVTVTEPQSDGFVTVYPCDVERPTVSNVNYLAGQTRPNLVTVKVPEGGGDVCFYTSATTHLVIDSVGSYTPLSNAGFLHTRPRRLFDTREGTDGPVEQEFTYWWTIESTDIQAVAWNLTVTQPTGDGFVTVWPCDDLFAPPTASNVNYRRGQTVANFAIGPVSANGRRVCFTSSRTTHMIVDQAGVFAIPLPWEGYYDGEPPATPASGALARIERAPRIE